MLFLLLLVKNQQFYVNEDHTAKSTNLIFRKKTKCKVFLPCPSYEVLQPSMLGKNLKKLGILS